MYVERIHSFHQILRICGSITVSGALVCQVLSSILILRLGHLLCLLKRQK